MQLTNIFYSAGVEGPDSAIHWIAMFPTFVNRYILRLRFGIYKLKFLRSIVGSRSVVSQLFGLVLGRLHYSLIWSMAYPGFVEPTALSVQSCWL